MSLTRRSWIAGAAGLPLVSKGIAAAAPSQPPSLPAKADFAPMSVTYLNSGSIHPFSLGAARALATYAQARTLAVGAPAFGIDAANERVRGKFARLVGVDPDDICLVQSTTAGEQLVVQALGFPARGGRIVTDTLHFFGSFYLYEALAKQGVEVVWLKPRDGRSIDMADLERAVTKDTRLVSISAVSTFNGFQHDLAKVSEVAHANGALVYADIIHAAGAVPLDLRASGVDFAACAGYKWLMGDFGLGFLYARPEALDHVKQTQFGYEGLSQFVPHVYPFDPPGAEVADYAPQKGARGLFATGTTSGAGAAQLDHSLDYIAQLGVGAIQRYRQPLLDHAREALQRQGFSCLTPEGATSPLLTFAYEDASSLAPRLDAAKVKITVSRNRFRLSPSVFNDMDDIDRLVRALTS